MSEGFSENLPPKKTGILKRAGELVTEIFPEIGLIAKNRRSRKIRAQIKVLPPDEKALQQTEPEQEISTLPNLEQNIKASEQFIKALRNPELYRQDPYESEYMKSGLGYLVEKPVEKGWFEAGSVVKTAEARYQLPLAIYVDDNHAKLLVKGPYQTPEGMAIKVYNPMLLNFQERRVNVDKYRIPIGVYNNLLSGRRIARGEYDLTKFLEDPELTKHRELLMNVKAFGFQRDPRNCIPYCLFVGAMLNGLDPGNTAFKTNGIRQFEQDFGVRIMTREEILPQKPRVRIKE